MFTDKIARMTAKAAKSYLDRAIEKDLERKKARLISKVKQPVVSAKVTFYRRPTLKEVHRAVDLWGIPVIPCYQHRTLIKKHLYETVMERALEGDLFPHGTKNTSIMEHIYSFNELDNATRNFMKVLSDLASKIEGFRIIFDGEVRAEPPRENYRLKKPLKRNVDCRIISSFPFISNEHIDLFSRPTPINSKPNSCFTSAIVNVFGPSIRKHTIFGYKRFDERSVWKLCKPGVPLPDNDEYPLSIEESIPFFF